MQSEGADSTVGQEQLSRRSRQAKMDAWKLRSSSKVLSRLVSVDIYRITASTTVLAIFWKPRGRRCMPSG